MPSSSTESDRAVTLVIPGRNCAATLRPCLSAALPLLDDLESRLAEIIFVDDGSTDDTAGIVKQFPRVRLLQQPNRGPSAARNNGWRNARTPLIWFIDSDCITEPDALRKLLPHIDDPTVGGVGGSYAIVNKDSRLARLIHEEIIQRHLGMSKDVNFLASFNVLYRTSALEKVGGFDELFGSPSAEDAQLSFRVHEAGWRLRFEIDSRVGHYHPTRLMKYLKTQARHGYWRAWLHLDHRGHAIRDSYSSWIDHAQPPIAMLVLALLIPTVAIILAADDSIHVRWLAAPPLFVGILLLAVLPLPMTFRLLRRVRRVEMLLYAPLSVIRAFWRGAGMTLGLLHYYTRRHRSDGRDAASQSRSS